jgi:hypothetical protein
MCNFLLKNLFFGSHKFAHSSLHSTNRVVVRASVAIDHQKFECLDFFKVVCHCESHLEIRIQCIIYLLSLTNFDPLSVLLLK